ncbi:molybdopterin-dependent oxidoreductase [Paenirhodobacter sp.]|uniref:molybdopterin-dependent oxidoreductase n=1 Tax=Paenirhodobacter sp. TaxID=1965326 RepID=UPI003B40B3BC
MTHLPDLRRRGLLMSLAAMALPGRAGAEGPVILTLVGPSGQVHALDEDAFAALPQHELTTHTVWTDGAQTFAGARLSDVLALAGTEEALRDRDLLLKALNDYTIRIPAADAWDYGALLARRQNGTALLRRDKGPLWLVYPRDSFDTLHDQRYDSRWVWQLSEIVIR